MRWLKTLHNQWMTARKRRVVTPQRGFRRDWDQLLADAGITSAEDLQAALREARSLPQLRLIPRKRNPRFIDKIELPPESETWLHEKFNTQTAAEAQALALEVVRQFAAQNHPLLGEVWTSFCHRLEEAFLKPRVLGPFDWIDASEAASLLRLLFDLTCREWAAGTLIRDASTRLGLESKQLEMQQNAIERSLELLFECETPLEALGIQTSNSVLHYSGPLTLHFADGTTHATDALRFESTLSVAELDRADRIETSVERVLFIENRKTTFLQFARADTARTTLLVATSFPTQSVRLLLQKLPADLPLHHFGDTDPSGWAILRQLREAAARKVCAFNMHWRSKPGALLTSPRDQQLITKLLSDPHMADCRADIEAMCSAGNKGDFEQESLGPPIVHGWPFL